MKRAHNPPKAAHKVHKRQKLEKATKFAESKQRRRVQLNDLGWKTVGMPDRLEDTEGFYGLEEIDDVEVLKDATTGNITFQTTKTEEQVAEDVEAAWKREEEEAARLEKMIGQEGVELPVEDEEAADEEPEAKKTAPEQSEAQSDNESFAGFSDDEQPATNGGIEIEDLDPNSAVEDGRLLKKDRPEKQVEKPKTKKEKKAEAKAKREAERKLKDNTAANAGESAETNPDYVEEEGVEATEDFEISGEGAFDILLNQPIDDDEVDTSAWEELGLSDKVIGALAGLKFSKPSNIQASTIPEIMAGRDLIGKASTGSGKTLAFGIPIIERYLATHSSPKDKDSKTPNVPTALIVAPTRELAHQITAHLNELCVKGDFVAPHIATITGGLSVQKQRRQLEKADVVVGTPGRLWEVISSGQGLLRSLKQVKFLVLDEADRLLSQGHYQELGEILKVLDREDDEADDETEPIVEVERQTLVFSATFSKGLQQKLAGKVKHGNGTGDILNKADSMEYLLKKLNFREEQPRYVDVNPESQMASKLREGLIECAGPEKDLYLYSLLLFHPNKRALIFTNSIAAVRRLTPFLTNLNLPALPLHSSMIQKARLRSIERFKERPGSILVATDVAARGLDIPKVDLVIHYHLPRAADTYVHRSGRTARADASGSSIIICGPEEVAGVRRLVAKVHARAESAKEQTNKKRAFFIRTLDIDRRIVGRLKPRATLSKKLADTVIAKEKKNSTDDLFMQAAEDLGIDYDSDEFEKEAKGKKGRGAGRKKKEKSASEMTRAEFASIRHELKGLLAERINTGVSARYLTSGGIDVEALMKGEGNTGFLGAVDGLGFDDDEDVKPAPAPVEEESDEEDEKNEVNDASETPKATQKPKDKKARKEKKRKRNADGTKKKWIHH
ncbi:P-loop containing nucleoside triphosphate hydrolase protein [Boeremia exigua]|uniref:P-loop containing nucleoside triphosphate hydrolase protein n=1 Tax=Boeremia exigua TaxID=749465 RepID=UPI001E8D9A3B|nr:P-loop containing nucleoside triphosphate hydrolase protein [Boeremia exigua]KAH6629122.1 P-loop containing nucleoside triphosphate hydrolase protein [Boeremia exigua]